MEQEVLLLHADGEVTGPMPRELAAFVVAFTLSGKRPEIIDLKLDIDESGGNYARNERYYLQEPEF